MNFESVENIPPTREVVVEALKNKGIDDTEVLELLLAYVVAQEEITDMLGGENKHEEVAIHMAEIYFDANYREYAVESLTEMEEMEEIGMSESVLRRIREVKKRMTDASK